MSCGLYSINMHPFNRTSCLYSQSHRHPWFPVSGNGIPVSGRREFGGCEINRRRQSRSGSGDG